MKALCREIALSRAFGRSSLPADRAQLEADPDNVFLARGPRGRLTAEQLRDSVLLVSGLINPKVGGPSVKPYQPDGLWEDAATQHEYDARQGRGPLPSQPLHVLASHLPAAHDDRLRCAKP